MKKIELLKKSIKLSRAAGGHFINDQDVDEAIEAIINENKLLLKENLEIEIKKHNKEHLVPNKAGGYLTLRDTIQAIITLSERMKDTTSILVTNERIKSMRALLDLLEYYNNQLRILEERG